MKRRSSLAFLPLVLCQLSGCSDDDRNACTLLDCTSQASLAAYYDTSFTELESATLSVCHNGSCATGKVATVPVVQGDRLRFQMTGALTVQAYVTAPQAGKGYKLEISISISGQEPQDGDDFLLTAQRQGAPAVDTLISEKATYEEVRPNGLHCPPVCYTTTIDKTL